MDLLDVLGGFAIFSSIGWIMLIADLDSHRSWRKRLQEETTMTTGVVTGYVSFTTPMGKSRHTYWVPMVRFPVYGQETERKSPVVTAKDHFPVGSQVTVYYDPHDPDQFHLQELADEVMNDRKLRTIGMIWILVAAVIALAAEMISSGSDFSGLGAELSRLGLRIRFFLRRLFR